MERGLERISLMADDAETNVIPCKWKKTAHGYRLWVRGRPDVFGEAESFEDAEQALTDAIWEAAEDLDAVIPTVPEYDPPLPASAIGEQFLKPELFLVSGDGVFDIEARAYARNEWSESREARLQEHFALLDSMYTGGLCRSCKHGIGNRTDQSFPIGSCDSAYDGGSIRNCYGFFASFGHIYSDGFISLLRTEEKARLEFRPLSTSCRRPRRKYFELLTAPEVAFVGVNGFDTNGYECGDCGNRFFYVDEPALNQGGFSINHFVCRSDLPDPLPSCFVVGTEQDAELCLTRERWDQIKGQRGMKGISGQRLGVISSEQCDRHPRLWKTPSPVRSVDSGSRP